ncbi:hypothetical protein EJB05_39166, partial [Eragrostis curvula]
MSGGKGKNARWPVMGSYTHMSDRRCDRRRPLISRRSRRTSPPRDVTTLYSSRRPPALRDTKGDRWVSTKDAAAGVVGWTREKLLSSRHRRAVEGTTPLGARQTRRINDGCRISRRKSLLVAAHRKMCVRRCRPGGTPEAQGSVTTTPSWNRGAARMSFGGVCVAASFLYALIVPLLLGYISTI